MLRSLTLLLAAALATPWAPAALAQSNVIPGTDVSLGALSGMSSQGRQGAFPGGVNAFAMATTACNVGSVNVPWLSPMAENHPLISFLVVREGADGRMVQISDRSYVKHGFFALSSSQCTPCQVPSNGTFLGIGCSDTYSVSNNANNFYLGPPEEIDPWLGTWTAVCSFFDAGTSPQPSTQCDGIRSFTTTQANNLGPVGNRVRVNDQELMPTGTYYYASHYVIRGEPEANRTNNMGSRSFVPTWSGSSWQIQTTGVFQQGSVLQRWTGALVSSNTQGTVDGRVYVGVKVTPLPNGNYRYEYAFHNRDHRGGIDGLRIPVCPSATLSGFSFRDLDADPTNDWTLNKVDSQIFIGQPGAKLRWNTIYNVGFVSDAAPVSGSIVLESGAPGPSPGLFGVSTLVPGSLAVVKIADGCSFGTPPTLTATGSPLLGSTDFALESQGMQANAPYVLFASAVPGPQIVDGCVAALGGLLGVDILQLVGGTAAGNGTAVIPLPVPANPALEGLTMQFQVLSLTMNPSPLLGVAELSDALRVRFGAGGCL